MNDERTWPAIVVGAGAAGLIAAIFAARGGVRTLLLETRPTPGAKIRISGGGRCNVLPSRVELDDFHTSGSRHTLRNILFSWPLEDVRGFFERDLGVALKVEETGKVFPRSDSSKEVVAALLREVARTGATLRGGTRVAGVQREEVGGVSRYMLKTASGDVLRSRRLVLATGGLSLPKTGSDGGGLAIAARLGHSTVETYPALVPLLSSDPSLGELSGLSVRARLTASRGRKTLETREGDFLFTHRGFSGPVVLDASYRVAGPDGENVDLRAHWAPDAAPDWDAVLRPAGKATVVSALRRHLPRRLADTLVARAGVDPGHRLSELPRAERSRLVDSLMRFPLPVAGNEGYRTAEVTAGGVPLEEIVPGTLESRIVPKLHLCGEILDATGRLGGYNFLWAWVTGRKAGLALR